MYLIIIYKYFGTSAFADVRSISFFLPDSNFIDVCLVFGHKIQFLRSRREGSRAEETNSWVDTIYCSYLHKQETWHKCAGPRKIRNLCDTVAVRAFEPLNGTFGRERYNKRVKKVSAWKLPWNENYVARRSVCASCVLLHGRNVASQEQSMFRVFDTVVNIAFNFKHVN